MRDILVFFYNSMKLSRLNDPVFSSKLSICFPPQRFILLRVGTAVPESKLPVSVYVAKKSKKYSCLCCHVVLQYNNERERFIGVVPAGGIV